MVEPTNEKNNYKQKTLDRQHLTTVFIALSAWRIEGKIAFFVALDMWQNNSNLHC